MGFVRLRDFGLILTPDRRVVTTRPVLDDGFGATVVGWEGNDLAMMELPKAGDATPAIPEPPRPPVVFASPPPPAPQPAPPPPPQPTAVAFAPTVLVTAIAPPQPAPVMIPLATPPTPTPTVQAPPVPEDGEDEWEWEIAVARARAEAEPVPAPKKQAPKATQHTTTQWLTREPLTTPWREDTAIRSVTQLARASEQQLAPRATPVPTASTTPRTIIPVPTLPVATETSRVRLDEVTRQLPMPRRMARGTASRAIANDETATEVRPVVRR